MDWSNRDALPAIEKRRLTELTLPEMTCRRRGFSHPAGVDEAGRGPLAGPVVAAACIVPEDVLLPGIDDSKKLSPVQRESLYQQIQSHSGIISAVAVVGPEVIDDINILQATLRAMREAVEGLSQRPDFLLVDGCHLECGIPCEKMIKGDSRSQSIAAASVLAKVTRDRLMLEFDELYPHYGFARHKGYGTQAHREAIREFGPCPIHRKSFAPVAAMLREALGV